MTRLTFSGSALLALALTATPALANKVWVVDDNGGPGVDFTDVDPAVAAAGNGDTLLLRSGSYSDLLIYNKSLSVIADTGQTVTIAGASIRNISADMVVRFSGLTLQSPSETGLQIKNNDGPVWIEDCTVYSANGIGTFISPDFHDNGYDGIEIASSSSVSIAGCTIVAGHGAHYIPLTSSYGGGGNGVHIYGASKVSLTDSEIHGGNGGNVFDDDAAWSGGWGGAGVWVQQGEVLVAGCNLLSGDGGIGGEDFDLFTGYSCGSGGSAGNGITGNFPGSSVLVRTRGNSFTSGTPGSPFPGSTCSAGSIGLEHSLASVSHAPLAGGHYGLEVASPTREGSLVTVAGDGVPGALLYLALSGSPTWSFLPSLGGLDLVNPTGLKIFPMGLVSANGNYAKLFPTPNFVPAGQAVNFYLQVVGIDPMSLQASLGAAASLSLLDSSL